MSAAPRRSYRSELSRLGDGETATAAHLAHAGALAESLAKLHGGKTRRGEDVSAYLAAVRALFEGERGLLRSVDTLLARAKPPLLASEACALEGRAVEWRARLRGRTARLCPLVGTDLETLDYPSTYSEAGAGRGEAAADLAPIAVGYLALGVDDAEAWQRSFAPLWNRFFRAYFALSGDAELLDVAPPFFAREALAIAAEGQLRRNAEARLVRFAIEVMARPALDPDAAERFVET
jgi:hypothetical protein